MVRSLAYKMAVAMIFAVAAAGCMSVPISGRDLAVVRAKDRVAPALVHIRPVKEVFQLGKREEILTIGSGFIITPDGIVVTNEHVTGKSKFVTCVLYDKSEVKAEVVGVDKFTDVAVLKLKTGRTDLPCAKLGDSSKLVAGQAVLALGSPHGLARSVSLGIVSVPDRYLSENGEAVAPFNNWIQTDAAINQGNSGGPLVNMKGEVIGINARILLNAENLSFAIPINIVKEVASQIRAQGRVKRGWIGATFQEMTRKTDDSAQKGVIVADMDPLSPGFEAGLRPGDVLLAVEGQPTDARFEEDLPRVAKLIADIPAGKTVLAKVLREGQDMDLKITAVEKSDLRGEEVEFKEWGFTAVDPTPELVRAAHLTTKTGIVITGVQVGGIAGTSGFKQGDFILTLNDEEVRDLAGFKRRYDEIVAAKRPLNLLVIKHGPLTRFVTLRQDTKLPEQGAPEDAK